MFDALAQRIGTYFHKALGPNSLNRRERAVRVLEEAIELAQAEGVPESVVGALTARVYSRPAGNPEDEVGGVAVTLLCWAYATGASVTDLATRTTERIEAIPVARMRERHAAKVALGLAVPSDATD
jgi:hypothetical protein